VVFAGTIAVSACSEDEGTIDGFTQAEWEIIKTLSPLPDPPPDPTNHYADDPAAAALGQALFFDPRASGPITFEATEEEGALGAVGDEQKAACTACHDVTRGFIDTRSDPPATSLGTGGWLGRNTLTLVNSVYYQWSGWQGFIDTYWGHSLLGIESAVAANGDRLRAAHLLYSHYREAYDAVFDPDLDPALDPVHPDASRFPPVGKPKPTADSPDGPWETMTPEDQAHVTQILVNAGKAMNAYIRQLVRRNAPFDRYVEGDTGAISAAAKRGLKLFIGKAGCVECHQGPTFSDDKFHNLGVPQEGLHVPAMDGGRADGIARVTGALAQWSSAGPYSDSSAPSPVDGLVATDADLGAFRTQSLRNVADTAPYMHTGQFATLRDVIELYNEGGKTHGFVGTKDELMKPLNLTEAEIDDLVAFLESLTGEPLPAALLEDTSAR
jgi:cytochrome c peroxidase